MHNLVGKNILFISSDFYGYRLKIKEKIIEKGARVLDYPLFPSLSYLRKKLYGDNDKQVIRYYKNILDEIKNQKFDFILIIRGDKIPKFFYEELKQWQSDAIKILYMWDTIDLTPGIKEVFTYFNKILTFDLKDSNSIVKFRPLFFLDEFVGNGDWTENKYTFSFVGFCHTDRYRIIKKIQRFADQHGFNYLFNLYLPTKINFLVGKYITKNLKGSKISDFNFKSLNHNEVANIMKHSQIIIDCQIPNQDGLTMRTIETIGMKKKLITTNSSVKKYNFFNGNNVLVIDRANPEIPKSFIEQPFVPLPNDIYNYYSLDYWIDEVFCD